MHHRTKITQQLKIALNFSKCQFFRKKIIPTFLSDYWYRTNETVMKTTYSSNESEVFASWLLIRPAVTNQYSVRNSYYRPRSYLPRIKDRVYMHFAN